MKIDGNKPTDKPTLQIHDPVERRESECGNDENGTYYATTEREENLARPRDLLMSITHSSCESSHPRFVDTFGTFLAAEIDRAKLRYVESERMMETAQREFKSKGKKRTR